MSQGVLLQRFFSHSIRFFLEDAPKDEASFKEGFHEVHSDWVDIKRTGLETFPLSRSLMISLVELFKKAEKYFYLIVGSSDSYAVATHRHKELWNELKRMTNEIVNR